MSDSLLLLEGPLDGRQKKWEGGIPKKHLFERVVSVQAVANNDPLPPICHYQFESKRQESGETVWVYKFNRRLEDDDRETIIKLGGELAE